ncbi:MAG: sigma-70 family RNA polymerase sigma factor [Bacteroidales bacterium]|nr:sigma-70 family RNA polymerase sigma factor [Bacteroidales bacterium]
MESQQLLIIKKCQAGDLDAFRFLVESNQDFAYNLAFKILANEEDAKDIVQEAFIRVWKNIKKYDSKNKFTTWLYKIVVNLCLDNLKMKKRRNIQSSTAALKAQQNNVSSGEDIEQKVIQAEMASLINTMTEKLTPKQRIMFVLFFLQEKSIEEIKTITGMSNGNIKSNIYYARKNMKLLLENKLMVSKTVES